MLNATSNMWGINLVLLDNQKFWANNKIQAKKLLVVDIGVQVVTFARKIEFPYFSLELAFFSFSLYLILFYFSNEWYITRTSEIAYKNQS